jgi:hypothetical protein
MSKYLLLFFFILSTNYTPYFTMQVLAQTIGDEGLYLILSVVVTIMPRVARLVLVQQGC